MLTIKGVHEMTLREKIGEILFHHGKWATERPRGNNNTDILARIKRDEDAILHVIWERVPKKLDGKGTGTFEQGYFELGWNQTIDQILKELE